jgi:Domain of unknown function (DUF4336)
MMLEKVGDAIWLAEGEIVSFYGFPYPTRSVVVRLGDGGLWVWSPVRLTADLAAALDRLGPVAHLVSPNKIHHLYLQDWAARYPEASLWGPRSTIDKRRDLTFAGALTDNPPPAWRAELDQAWFRGSPVIDEVVFYHRASRTVILADLIENFSDAFLHEHWRWWQRLYARPGGITTHRPRAPIDMRLTFIHRKITRQARDKVLSWECERVVMAHGEWQRDGGHAFLARSFDWLGP